MKDKAGFNNKINKVKKSKMLNDESSEICMYRVTREMERSETCLHRFNNLEYTTFPNRVIPDTNPKYFNLTQNRRKLIHSLM